MNETTFTREQRQEIGDYVINAVYSVLERIVPALCKDQRQAILKDVQADAQRFEDEDVVPHDWTLS